MTQLLTDFQNIFVNKLGLNPDLISNSHWKHMLDNGRIQAGFSNESLFLEALYKSDALFHSFVEEIVVTETWFFRNKQALDYLVRVFFQKALELMASKKSFRILSAACSSGEEPYSIVMALLEQGISAKHIKVDAVDISGKAIQKAQVGIYSNNSFRGKHLAFRNKYFESCPGGYRLASAKVRDAVNFIHGNLCEPESLFLQTSYDAIFCRNLLIYMNDNAQEKLCNVLTTLLEPDGLIFFGAVETQIVKKFGLIQEGPGHACAFKETKKNQPKLNRLLYLARKSNKRETQTNFKAPIPTALAQRLADQGNFDFAIIECQKCLEEDSKNAEAWYLLGVIYNVLREVDEAKRCLNKAIELEPNYRKALFSLALLMKKEADSEAKIVQIIDRKP